ncbi:MAG: ABC transporter substrate-binding protein, partial [Verrucomicrobia bacterium]|nr:ABC transporter substrate-binding protein [Verrucomicrobiota bacterium]
AAGMAASMLIPQDAAKEAAQTIATQPLELRASWDLESAIPLGNSLTLRFTHPGGRVADEVMAVLSAKPPQKLAFLRIASTPSMRPAIQAYADHPDFNKQTKRVWFDDDGSCELVTSLTGLQAQQQLIDWLLPRHSPLPEITPIAEVPALLEPVLDFRFKPGLRWDDGSPITAADVRATVNYVLPRPWPLPGRDLFRHIQSVSQTATGVVRIVYRKRYSPTLASWTALPILPASWLKRHENGFGADLPPGAGEWRLTKQEPTRLWLGKRDSTTAPSLQILAATAPLQTRVGLSTHIIDVWWPNEAQDKSLAPDSTWQLLPTPPHSQLMLVWQTESPLVKDIQVRQALSLALNRESLRHEMPGGKARLHDSFFPPGRWFSAEPLAVNYDPNAAEQLFAKAGWLRTVSGDLKKSGQPMNLRIIVPEGNDERLRLANALALSWQKAGLKLQVDAVPTNRYRGELQAGNFDLALLGSELSPGWDVLPFWHSSQSAGQGANVSRIADPQLDLLLDALVSEFDASHLQRRASAVEARLAELRPALPLFTDVADIAIRPQRFPGLRTTEVARGITLRQLMSGVSGEAPPTVNLQMISPK